MFRTCLKCEVHQPTEEFGFLNRATGKRKLYCVTCESQRMRAYYKAHRRQVLDTQKAQKARKAQQRAATKQRGTS